MRTLQLPAFAVRIVAVPLFLAGAVPGFAPAAPAAATRTGPAGPSLFTGGGALHGVAAASAGSAWAVGSTGEGSSSKTLIVHWNGTAWTQVPSPDPEGNSILNGVAAASADSAWAVGSTGEGSSSKTLILHWNGAAWTRVPSPSPTGSSQLSGVAAGSARSAWAVGLTYLSSGVVKPLIVHWNGTAWTQVPSPEPSGSYIAGLSGVTAISAGSAWAVGDSSPTGCACIALILHWNGSAWTQAPSPNPAVGVDLSGVAAVSVQNAWAVGSTAVVGARTSATVILRWNGAAWQRVPSPNPEGNAILNGVAAASAGNAWAVGSSGNFTSPSTLILRWNGTTWT